MAIIENERDNLLQATVPRINPWTYPPGVIEGLPETIESVKGVKITAPSTVFQVSAAGVASPASITLTAVKTLITGTVTWSVVSGAVTGFAGTGDTRTVLAASLTTASATLRASVTFLGVTYTSDWTLAKTADGAVGTSPITIRLAKPSWSLPAQADGVVTSYFNSNNTLSVFEGDSQLNYDGVGTSAGNFTVTGTGTNIVGGSISKSGLNAFIGNAGSASPGNDVLYVTYDVSGRTGANVSFTGQIVYSFGKSKAGLEGQKRAVVTAFRWSNSGAGSYTQAATYSWSTSQPNTRPAGWSQTAPASPGSGYTLFMLSVEIVAPGDATTTSFNWSSGSIGTVGYTQDGSIGPQGPGARIAYRVTTSSAPPALGATQPVTGDTLPDGSARPGSTALNTWSATPKASLAEGEFMYQSDGVYNPVTNQTTWQLAYLSNLKVGSLSAISAKLGVVEVASGGSLYSGKSGPASSSAGFWVGYSGTEYTLFIGNSGNTQSFKYDTTNGVVVKGGSITGSVFRTGLTGPRVEIFGTGQSSDVYKNNRITCTNDAIESLIDNEGYLLRNVGDSAHAVRILNAGGTAPRIDAIGPTSPGSQDTVRASAYGNAAFHGVVAGANAANAFTADFAAFTNSSNKVGYLANMGDGIGARFYNNVTNKTNPDLVVGNDSTSIGGVIKLKKRTTFPPAQDELLMNHSTHGLCGCNGTQWIRIVDGVVVG